MVWLSVSSLTSSLTFSCHFAPPFPQRHSCFRFDVPVTLMPPILHSCFFLSPLLCLQLSSPTYDKCFPQAFALMPPFRKVFPDLSTGSWNFKPPFNISYFLFLIFLYLQFLSLSSIVYILLCFIAHFWFPITVQSH